MLQFILTVTLLATPTVELEYHTQQARGAVAVSTWVVSRKSSGTVKPNTPPAPAPSPTACQCGGTGKSGDGIGPCPCIANSGSCKCKGAIPPADTAKKVVAKPFRQILDFTQPNCAPCRRREATVDKELRKLGWVISYDAKAHIRKVDVTVSDNPWIAKLGIDSTPQLICVEGDKLVGRLDAAQALSAKAVTDLYYSTATPKAVTVQAVPPIHRTWPGDLRKHLQQEHGTELPTAANLNTMTQSELEALHDRLHQQRVAQGLEAMPISPQYRVRSRKRSR